MIYVMQRKLVDERILVARLFGSFDNRSGTLDDGFQQVHGSQLVGISRTTGIGIKDAEMAIGCNREIDVRTLYIKLFRQRTRKQQSQCDEQVLFLLT